MGESPFKASPLSKLLEAAEVEVAGGLKMGAKSLCVPLEDRCTSNCPRCRCIVMMRSVARLVVRLTPRWPKAGRATSQLGLHASRAAVEPGSLLQSCQVPCLLACLHIDVQA